MPGLPISRPAFDDTQEPWENYTSGGEEMRRRLQNKHKGIGLLDLGPNGTYTHRRITKISWFEGKLTGKTGGRSPAQWEAMAKPMKDSSHKPEHATETISQNFLATTAGYGLHTNVVLKGKWFGKLRSSPLNQDRSFASDADIGPYE